MTDPTNNPPDEATPDTSARAEAPPPPRRRPDAVRAGAVSDAAAPNGAWGAGRDARRRGARARHVAQRWPLPAPRRGPLWGPLRRWWWVWVAVLAGASGALITLGVLALSWPH